MRFRDRVDAGRQLAERLAGLRDDDVVVLALPRGGVPVAAEVAGELHAPLDVLVVRKVGLPRQPELGVGAVGEGGEVVWNTDLLRELGATPEDLHPVADRETEEVARRVARYRGDAPGIDVRGRTVVVVDDGLATGFTARAGVEVARRRGAARVVVAVPVGSRSAVADLDRIADEVVCLATPSPFRAIGLFYDDFDQVSDDRVVAGLQAARSGGAGDDVDRDAPTLEVDLDVDGVTLPAAITVPTGAAGLVVFAHGSGSSRYSRRNRAVAAALVEAGYATLLLDLLTPDEARDRAVVFDVDRLRRRLVGVVDWVHDRPALAGLPVVLFGASTGAAGAVAAAADLGDEVALVVSRGGRPDLARDSLRHVTAPTLLVVGGDDGVVLDLNRRAARRLHCEHDLVVVPGASHLFEEHGAMDRVVAATLAWLDDHLRPRVRRA